MQKSTAGGGANRRDRVALAPLNQIVEHLRPVVRLLG